MFFSRSVIVISSCFTNISSKFSLIVSSSWTVSSIHRWHFRKRVRVLYNRFFTDKFEPLAHCKFCFLFFQVLASPLSSEVFSTIFEEMLPKFIEGCHVILAINKFYLVMFEQCLNIPLNDIISVVICISYDLLKSGLFIPSYSETQL
jgi:hypothetical protein